METLQYIPAINAMAEIQELGKKAKAGDTLLLGEYGSLNPLSLISEVRSAGKRKIYLELTLKNRNRELFDQSLRTASAVGFDGAVIASGLFDKKGGMGKPVYDLDQAQALRRALSLIKDGAVSKDFKIGVRSAAGTGAVRERAAAYLRDGADFIAILESVAGEDSFVKEFGKNIMLIREL